MKPISTKMHDILDYVTVGSLLVMPRILRCSASTRNLLAGMAAGLLGYSIVTRDELSVAKLVPMKTHLLLDGMSGALLAAAPWLTFEDEPSARLTIAGVGAFEIAASLLTRTEPPLAEQTKWMLQGKAA